MPVNHTCLRLTALAGLALLVACEPPDTDDSLLENQPPQTHLSIGYFRADSSQVDTLGLSSSNVSLAWWGEDADGWIESYQYRWLNEDDTVSEDFPAWEEALHMEVVGSDTFYSVAESDTFVVRLTDSLQVVKFEVRAIDNVGAVDDTPASTIFPAYNTAPNIAWVAESQELLRGDVSPTHPLPDTTWTFPWIHFHVNIWDVDGNETIVEAQWVLDDTTATWNTLDLGTRSVALDETTLEPGAHRIFVRARDVANAWSQTLSYPADFHVNEEGDPLVWMVRDPAGELLVVFDDVAESTEGPVIIQQGLSEYGFSYEQDYSWWDVTEWLPYDDQDFSAILEAFDKVFWFSWKQTQMEAACDNLDLFIARGGKLMISTTDVGRYSETSESAWLYDGICVPVDSLTHQRHHIFPLTETFDQPITPAPDFDDRYPVMYSLERITFQGNGITDADFGFVPDSSAVELYFVPEDAGNPESYPRVTVAARQPADGNPAKAKQLWFSLPLHKMDNLPALFETVIDDEFNW